MHSFGMTVVSGQENATEEQNSTLIRTDAHSDAVSATSNQWSHEKKEEALEMGAFSFYWKTLHLECCSKEIPIKGLCEAEKHWT